MGPLRGIALVLLVGSALPALAEVKLDVRADGIKVIKGEPPAARARRLSGRLLAVPSEKLSDLLDRWSGEHELDSRLVHAVVQVESGYNPRALSNKGAIGLMQLMPETARELGVGDPWDPEQNVRGGTAYLKQMIDMFSGDLELALAAYNAGPTAVLDHAGIPPYADTRAYVRQVLCLYDGDCETRQIDSDAGSGSGRSVRIVRDAEGRLVLTSGGPGG
jgi:soluble lytic murein transglycosylase-like protein